jgi:hypothetical protein
MSAQVSDAAAEDRRLLEEAAAFSEAGSIEELTAPFLLRLTQTRGVDFATAVLYERLRTSPHHGAAIARLDELRSAAPEPHALSEFTVAVAPGAFYREFPHTGADGRLLREAAEKFGANAALIPATSTGSLAENARSILEWLRTHREQPMILASVSKGGSDIKTALSLPGAAEAFRHVVAWISVCGILDGSPNVNWLLSRPLRCAFYRVLFRLRSYNFDVIRDLRHGPGSPLNCPLRLPSHVTAIHVVGFPLTSHLTNRLSRTLHSRVAALGPNDGAIRLIDACQWPGVVYPVWGADHYLRPSWELRSLAKALFAYLAESVARKEICP